MKRILPLLLSTLLIVSCAGTDERGLSVSKVEEDALRAVLVEACDQIAVNLFSDFNEATYIGSGYPLLVKASAIPLIREDAGIYGTLVGDAFRTVLLSMRDIITPLAMSFTIADPHAMILSSDDSASIALGKEAGEAIRAEVRKRLEGSMEEALKQKASIEKNIAIWNRGQEMTGGTRVEPVRFMDLDELASLFCERYMKALEQEEANVRTTPRMKGTGSLYEFFSSIRKEKGKKQ